MVAACGTGSGSMRGTGNGLGDGNEAACLADCRFVAEGGAGSAEDTGETEAEGADVEDAAGRGHHLRPRPPRIPAAAAVGRARSVSAEGGKTAEGNAGDEGWREGEEEEGGRRDEKRSESRPSCGC